LGGSIKASLHQSGKWHIAYSQQEFERSVEGIDPKFIDRFIEKWPRPKEIAPGITLAFRIVTPSSAVKNPIDPRKEAQVTWLPNAPVQKATEIDIFLLKKNVLVSGWPGKNSMGTSLVGTIPLENGDTVWVVHWVVEMPDLSHFNQAKGTFFKGRNRSDLQEGNLRAIVFGSEPDGSRVMYDCAVER